MGTKINNRYLIRKYILMTSLLIGFAIVDKQRALGQTQVYSAENGQTQAVVVDEAALAHTSQFIALNKEGKLIGKGSIPKQVDQIFKQLSFALKGAHSGIDGIVKINVCLKDATTTDQVTAEINRRFNNNKKPALSFVTGDLRHPDALLSIDAVAVSTSNTDKVSYFYDSNSASNTQEAKASILPAGPSVYVSGQAAKGGLAEATEATLIQLEETLKHLGLHKKDIVQLKSFVHPFSDTQIAEKVISRFFSGSHLPPLIFIEWLSTDPVIEIELIAASPNVGAREQLEYITPPGMTASPIYAKVCRVNYGKKIYLSGLYGQSLTDPVNETKEIFESLEQIMKKVGSDLNHLIKATYYVSDNRSSTDLNTIRPQYYHPKRPPAASKAMVRGVGKTGANITIDMIGLKPITTK